VKAVLRVIIVDALLTGVDASVARGYNPSPFQRPAGLVDAQECTLQVSQFFGSLSKSF
jgi:hypothetical protein